jgi:long-chain acyl-CoA synthetase
MRFVETIERLAREHGERPATIMASRRRTWAESARRTACLGGALLAAGARAGSLIGILAANSDHYLEAVHACWWIGAVAVPMNSRWALPEHVEAASDAGLEILFADAGSLGMAEAVQAACPSLRQIFLLGEALDALIARFEPCAAQPAPDDAPASIFYTGGATGRPKGVVHSGGGLWNAATIGARGLRLPERPVYLHAAPMFHLGGMMPAFTTTSQGGTHVFIEAFRPAAVAEVIRAERVTFTALVPIMIGLLVDDPAFRVEDYASLRLVQYGGGAISTALRERLATLLPATRFEQGYGQSEVGGGISTLRHELMMTLPADDPRRRSAGRAHPGVEIAVTDEEGQALGPELVGEFRVRSPGAMLGYLNRPEESAATLADGWVRTGDAGYLDADGFVFVCDRIKDVVRPGGENVFSAEVENAVAAHPAVLAVAVIAVPDDRWEERVHAVVTLREGAALALDALQEHCRERIAGYKIPRSMEVIEAMPLSGAGKIQKAILREPHWRDRERMRR